MGPLTCSVKMPRLWLRARERKGKRLWDSPSLNSSAILGNSYLGVGTNWDRGNSASYQEVLYFNKAIKQYWYCSYTNWDRGNSASYQELLYFTKAIKQWWYILIGTGGNSASYQELLYFNKAIKSNNNIAHRLIVTEAIMLPTKSCYISIKRFNNDDIY